MKLYDLGNRAVEQVDLRTRVRPFFRKLSQQLGETMHLGVLQKTSVVYLDKADASRRVCSGSKTGSSNPVYCTAMGKAMLAFLPEDRINEIIRRTRFEKFTHRTIATAEALRTEIEKTRRRGYAVDDEELEEGLRCIAVPLLDAQRQPVAAVSVSGPSFRVTAQKLPSIANHLLQCVRGISMDMGFTAAARGNRTAAAWTA